MKAAHRLLLAVLVVVLPAGPALSQHTGRVEGRVVDEATKQPLPGASVRVVGTDFGAAADSTGIYRIEHLAEGVYALEVRFLGYAGHIQTDVRVVRAKTAYVNEVALAAVPLEGAGVTVTPAFATAAPSSHAFQREEIRRHPGTAGDVFRAVGSLPGVSTSEGEFSAMSVRGGGVYDNLILIDNIPFDKINHFEGGSREQEAQGGRFSIFTAGLLERAAFSGGGFGAEYGGKAASVLDLTIREGNTTSPHLSGSYDLLGPEVTYDGPTYLLGNTSLLLNVRDFDLRRGLEIAGQEDFGDPTMADVVAKTTTHLGARHKLSLLGIHSTDRLVRAPRHVMAADDLVENDLWDVDETRRLLGANWRLLTGDASVLHNTVYVRTNDRFRSYGHAWSGDGRLPASIAGLGYRDDVGRQDQREVEVGWKAGFLHAAGPAETLQAGVEAYRVALDYAFDLDGPDTLYQFTSLDLRQHPGRKYVVVRPEDVAFRFDGAATNAAAYASYEVGRGRFTLTPGLRYSYSGFSRTHNVAPRFQARYHPAPRTTLTLAGGLYHQKPLYRYVAAHPANRALRDERAVHLVAGVHHLLRPDLRLTLEGYYKHLDRLATPTAAAGARMTDRGNGWSSGFDALLLKRFTGRYYGQASYSYAVSRRDDHDGLGPYDAPHNQPHNFAVIGGIQLSDAWFVSARWKYAAGRPKDRYVVHADVLGDPERMRYAREITARNADRMDAFHLLSVRVDYRAQLGPVGLVTFVDLDNLYNRPNTYEDRFSELTGAEKGLGFGFLANAGFKLEL